MGAKYFGKYRAKVVDVKDPRQKGRIRVQIPTLLGTGISQWCEPCTPIGYDNGGDLAVPKLNDTVWVEFEEGNVSKPIYVGNFWSAMKTPLNDQNYDTDTRVINWDKCTITMKNDEMVITGGSSVVTINDSGIKLNGTKIDLNT